MRMADEDDNALRRITPDLMAYYKRRAHQLRAEACRDAWRWLWTALIRMFQR